MSEFIENVAGNCKLPQSMSSSVEIAMIGSQDDVVVVFCMKNVMLSVAK
jgi:hypothetical protein